MRSHRAFALLALGVVSCGFGEGVVRPNDVTVVENRGANRYVYHLTRLSTVPPKPEAAPALAVAPPRAREIGLIEVTADFSGSGPAGLRATEAEFFPRLGAIAGELGGTHFMVLRTTRDARTSEWITSLTVSVLDAGSP